jgi:uncharacterized protein YlxW (UPF0749 family)
MTLTTSGKESTRRMSSLKPHKRGRRILKKNAELAERVAKLETRLAELEA